MAAPTQGSTPLASKTVSPLQNKTKQNKKYLHFRLLFLTFLAAECDRVDSVLIPGTSVKVSYYQIIASVNVNSLV